MKDNQAEKDLENAIAQAIAANPEFNQKVAIYNALSDYYFKGTSPMELEKTDPEKYKECMKALSEKMKQL
tara:strand:+ start:836 stop:1045 length:210 start_codon:yes stop_codon:yes gene_type:complete